MRTCFFFYIRNLCDGVEAEVSYFFKDSLDSQFLNFFLIFFFFFYTENVSTLILNLMYFNESHGLDLKKENSLLRFLRLEILFQPG